MVKMTFTFDDQTVETLRRAASRLKNPQSVVVREAIQDYASRTDRLSEEERQHMWKVFAGMVARIPTRSQTEADAEIAAIRKARRTGGRSLRMTHLDTSVLIDAFYRPEHPGAADSVNAGKRRENLYQHTRAL